MVFYEVVASCLILILKNSYDGGLSVREKVVRQKLSQVGCQKVDSCSEIHSVSPKSIFVHSVKLATFKVQ